MTVAAKIEPEGRFEDASLLPGGPTDAQRSALDRQLLIDVSTVASFDARTGIQRVVRAIATAVQAFDIPRAKVRLVAASKSTFYRQLPDNWLEGSSDRKLDLSTLPEVSTSAGDIFLGLDFSSSILPRHEQALAEWRRRGVSIHIVLYDLLPMSDGRWFTYRMRNNFRRWLKVVGRQADQIIAISQSVADEFRTWQSRAGLFRGRQVPVAVARLGSDIAASLPSRGVPANGDEILAWLDTRPTILMVGTVEPRKGHEQALAGFQRLWNASPDAPQLMMIGRGGWKTARLQKNMRQAAEEDQRFLWLEGTSDEFLEEIYRRAAGLLVASEGEGFGLPIVEGLSHGLPVLVRDLPVFRELQGPGVTFFSGKSPSDLAKAINEWVRRDDVPEKRVGRRTCSWQESATDILGFLLAGAEGIGQAAMAARGAAGQMNGNVANQPRDR